MQSLFNCTIGFDLDLTLKVKFKIIHVITLVPQSRVQLEHIYHVYHICIAVKYVWSPASLLDLTTSDFPRSSSKSHFISERNRE